MIIFPAVDIKDGVCVRLVQGKKEDSKVYGRDPVEMALNWQSQGARYLHVVDLDGAFSGVPKNRDLIRRIAASLSIPMQLGGGIRDLQTATEYLNAGVSRIIVGTRAQQDQDFVSRLLDQFGPERFIVGIDARDGMVAVHGWEDVTETPALELAQAMKARGVLRTIYTDVSRDGLLQGPNLPAIREMADQSGLSVIASGGVTTVDDLMALKALPGVEGAIVGKALYEARFTLSEALAAVEGKQ
ncbi:MAG: 1-(5-phosphoribosyl)-5-[(5-phosphoribosylamino)methylideneamino]imidazole-4-carboxamide isomerase [Solirubrobacterales bacterium]